MHFRNFALYLIGLAGFLFSGIAAAEDLSFANLAVIMGSLAALLVDFLWVSTNSPPETNQRRGWGIAKWGGFALAAVAIASIYVFLPSSNRLPPNLEIAWYYVDDGALKLADPFLVPAELTVDEILTNQLHIPITLAVRSNDPEPLKVTRVELSYDSGLKITSSAKAKIDPSGNKLIYEHDIGTLERQNEFTPLEEIDVLKIHHKFLFVQAVAILGDQVPINISTLIGQDMFDEQKITLGVRVFSLDRPPAIGQVTITPTSGVQVFTALDQAERAPNLPSDAEIFGESFPSAEIVSEWVRYHAESKHTVSYVLLKTEIGMIRKVAVDGVVRHVAVDSDFDGSLEFLLLKGANDENIIRLNSNSSFPVVDWKPEFVSD